MPILSTGAFFNLGGVTNEGGGGGSDGVFALTVAATGYSTDLTDFPLAIWLDQLPTTGFWDTTNDGEDIRVSISGVSVPVDLIYCDTGTETGLIYVKVPTLSATLDTEITLEIDGVSSKPADTDTYGRNNVWSDYECVVIPYDTLEDRTGNNGTGTEVNGPLSLAGATGPNYRKAGGGAVRVDYASTQSYEVSVADISTFSGIITMAASYLSLDARQVNVLSYRDESSGATNDRISLDIDNGDMAAVWDNSNSWLYSNYLTDPDTTYWDRIWTTYNAGTDRNLHSTSPYNYGTDTTVTNMSSAGLDMLSIGRADPSEAEVMDGYIGWFYLKSGNVSTAWMEAEQRMLEDRFFAKYTNDVFSTDIGTNVGFETGDDTGWTLTNATVEGTTSRDEIVDPAFGSYQLQMGNAAAPSATQDIDISAYSLYVDAGDAMILVEFGIGQDYDDGDDGHIQIEFLDGTASSLSIVQSSWFDVLGVGYVTGVFGGDVPATARTARVTYEATRDGGTVCNVVIDVNYIKLVYKT